MRHFIAVASLTGFSMSAFGADRRGQVLCDITQPRQHGFALVELRDNQRSYQGYHDFGSLRLKGSYSPDSKQLTLNLVRFNPDTLDEGATIVESVQKLETASYLKLAITLPKTEHEEAANVAFFCRVHWN